MTDIEKVIEEARAAALPFESWERLPGESAGAYFAFCAYRDYGAERNIRKAVEAWQQAALEKDETKRGKRYGTWRNWAAAFRWRERAADYDRYTEKLKLAEKRKTIEAQEEQRRMVTGKMLSVVEKKLDLMDPADLTQGAVTAWVETAVRAEREVDGPAGANNGGAAWRQGEISFAPEFNGV